MTQHALTRRRLLAAGLICSAVAPRAALAQAAAPAQRFRGVAVDVSPLIDHGGGNTARAFAPVLQGQMRTVFADRLAVGAAGAPVLTARITDLFLAEYNGQGADFAFGNNDTIEGDGIVTGGGRVLSTTHILTELPPSYSGGYLTEGIDAKRFVSIAYQFAWWLRREMGL